MKCTYHVESLFLDLMGSPSSFTYLSIVIDRSESCAELKFVTVRVDKPNARITEAYRCNMNVQD